jgi:proteasome component ECM29
MSIKRQRSLSCSNDDDDGEEIQQRRMNGETTDDATTALVGELRKELNSLQRVSHRLVVTDDSALTNVLNGLLPRLFHRVTLHDNAQKQKNAESYRDLPVVKELYDNIHSQLMQILSHALTRVKASNQMELPCLSLLQHLVIQDTDGLMIIHETVPQITFRLMIPFLKIGIPRMKPPKTSSSSSSSSSIQQLLSYLIVLLGSPEHQVAVTPLFCMALEQWCGTGTSFDPDIMGESTRTLLCQRPTLANAVYQVVLDVLLWSPTSTGTTTNTSSPSSSSLPPPGLSKLSQQRCPSPVSKNMRKSMLLAIVPNQRFRILWDTPANIARAMILWVVGCSCCSNSDDGLGGNGSTTATAVGTAVLQKYVTRQSQSSRSDSGLGDPEIVGSELLGLVLGLGEGMAKRRPVTENAAVFIVQFVTTHVIPNISLFKTSTQATTSSNDNNKNNQDGQNLKPETQAQTPLVIQKVWSLALTVVENTLIASSTLTNRSATKLAVAVAQLTSALAVRLVQQHNAQDDEECNNMNTTVVNNLQAKCRIVASSVLSSSVASLGTNWSNSRNTRIYDVAGEQALNVREVCYEILAVLARSSTAETTVLPMETVSMLFQCTTYEEERLRTKAVAALDAVLVAYQRLCCRTLPPCSTDIAKLRDTAAATKTTSDGTSASVHGESENNPWLNNQTAETMDVREEKSIQKTTNASLAKSLLPLLWSAAESHRPKASRVAAARWASNVLKHIDLVKACHLLCYLAGDTDVTVARIAKEEGLGLSLTFSETIGVNEEEMIMSLVKSSVDLHDQRQVPSFGEITDVLFVADTETAATTQAYTWRIQRFQDFSVQGKAASLRFALICLLSDLYDGSDTSIGMFLSAITETLLLFLEKSSGISGKGSSEQTNVCVDLLDESAACLLATISSSKHARLLISPGIDEEDNVKAKLAPAFGLEEIENLVMRANSSLARRHLAAAFGKILQDVWSTMSCDDFVKWIEQSRLHKTLESCLDNMQGLETTTKPTSRLHGSLFLGAHVMRAFRCSAARFPCQNASESMLHKTWKQCNDTLVSLGKALSHTDEQIGSASADCLSIAFSYESDDALEFDSRLYDSARNVLTMLSAALKKFGHGDFVDPQRSTRIARAAGVCLAATTIGSSIDRTEHVKIGSCRLECASSLVEILGSASYRKSEEISIAVGEALGEYADAYSPMNVVWTCPDPFEWPVDFSEEYAKQLPPHDHTVFVLLRSISTSTDPHKKTACAPALLAVVARCARKVSFIIDQNISRNKLSHNYIIIGQF